MLANLYSKCFGWEIEEWMREEVQKEENRYWLIKAGEKEEVGSDSGMYKRQEPISKGGPNCFMCSIAVNEIEKAVDLAKENGGHAEKIMDIQGVGKSSNPEGNMFGVFWADPNAKMMDM